MDNTLTSRKIQAAETKRRIYESAVKLLRERGINNLSVDDIVEAAGVAKGTFYVYYKSKFSLISDYVCTLDLSYEDFFNSIPPDTKPLEMLLQVTGKIADIMISDIGFDVIRTIYEALVKKAEGVEALLSYHRKLYQLYSEIITQGVQQGEFRETIDIDSVTNHCIMSIRGMTFEWCIRYPDFDFKEEVLEHFNILLAGIKNREK